MTYARKAVSTLLIALLAVSIGSCKSSTTGGGGNGGNSIADPAFLEAFLSQKLPNAAAGVMDGFGRLLTAIQGGGMDGVVIVPTGVDSYSAEMSIDLNGDGSRESTITGSLAGDIGTGAQIYLTDVDDPGIPSLSVGASSDAMQISAVSVLFDNMSGTLTADPPGSGNAGEAEVTEGVMTLDLVAQRPLGYIEVNLFGEDSAFLAVHLSFEVAGSGWQLRVTGDGVDFTIP